MMNIFLGNDTGAEAIGAILGAFFIYAFTLLFCLAIIALGIIALTKIFKKAGVAAWKALIPYYNLYLLCEIVLGAGWKFFLLLIPYFGTVYACIVEYKLGKAFGKSTGFCVLSIFFSPVTRMILAFGDNEYNGPVR